MCGKRSREIGESSIPSTGKKGPEAPMLDIPKVSFKLRFIVSRSISARQWKLPNESRKDVSISGYSLKYVGTSKVGLKAESISSSTQSRYSDLLLTVGAMRV